MYYKTVFLKKTRSLKYLSNCVLSYQTFVFGATDLKDFLQIFMTKKVRPPKSQKSKKKGTLPQKLRRDYLNPLKRLPFHQKKAMKKLV